MLDNNGSSISRREAEPHPSSARPRRENRRALLLCEAWGRIAPPGSGVCRPSSKAASWTATLRVLQKHGTSPAVEGAHFVRIIRHLFILFAVLAVVALPGPSHAMPSHAMPSHGHAGSMHITFAHSASEHDASDDSGARAGPAHNTHLSNNSAALHFASTWMPGADHPCPGRDHDHGKCCMSACCASTCLSLADLTSLPTPRLMIAATNVVTDDLDRAGAVHGLPKRPPKSV